jgi:hypothetical protein
VLLTPGQAGDNPQLFALLDAIRVHDGTPGRPRKKPDMLIADKAYAHDPTVAGYGAAASATPSRNAPINSPAGPPKAAAVDAHPPSTSRSTGSETWWNAASTG